MQQLLRRLVFDVPMLTEYCKIPLQVGESFCNKLFQHVPVAPQTLHQRRLTCFDPHLWKFTACWWFSQSVTSSLSSPPVAADQPLRAELEVLLSAVWYGQLWHGLRGGAPPHQEALLGNI